MKASKIVIGLIKGRAQSRPRFEVTMMELEEDPAGLLAPDDSNRERLDTDVASGAIVDGMCCQLGMDCGLW